MHKVGDVEGHQQGLEGSENLHYLQQTSFLYEGQKSKKDYLLSGTTCQHLKWIRITCRSFLA